MWHKKCVKSQIILGSVQNNLPSSCCHFVGAGNVFALSVAVTSGPRLNQLISNPRPQLAHSFIDGSLCVTVCVSVGRRGKYLPAHIQISLLKKRKIWFHKQVDQSRARSDLRACAPPLVYGCAKLSPGSRWLYRSATIPLAWNVLVLFSVPVWEETLCSCHFLLTVSINDSSPFNSFSFDLLNCWTWQWYIWECVAAKMFDKILICRNKGNILFLLFQEFLSYSFQCDCGARWTNAFIHSRKKERVLGFVSYWGRLNKKDLVGLLH